MVTPKSEIREIPDKILGNWVAEVITDVDSELAVPRVMRVVEQDLGTTSPWGFLLMGVPTNHPF